MSTDGLSRGTSEWSDEDLVPYWSASGGTSTVDGKDTVLTTIAGVLDGPCLVTVVV